MAKREFSSTLKNLKFMQRAANKAEKPKGEEAKLQPDDVFGSSASLSRKWDSPIEVPRELYDGWLLKRGDILRCLLMLQLDLKGRMCPNIDIVITEGNPHPGAIKGRMSFQNFNPSIDKMNQEAANSHKLQAFISSNENQNATTSDRDDEYPSEYTNREIPGNHPEIDLKRKQPEVETEASHPHNSQRNSSGDGDGRPSSQNNRKGSYKQQKREKLDWNVLRPPKAQARRDAS